MKIVSEYIGSQFGNPRGIIGKICCKVMNQMNKKMYESVVNSIEKNKNTKVLDIGFGNGYLLKQLHRKVGGFVYGIDRSEDMKIEASMRNKKAIEEGKMEVSIGDCCKMKYESNFFQMATSVNTIYFWENTLSGLEEVYRVLNKQGIFLIAIYSKKWLEKLSYTKKGFQLFTPEDIVELGKKAGFREIEIKNISHENSFLIICKK